MISASDHQHQQQAFVTIVAFCKRALYRRQTEIAATANRLMGIGNDSGIRREGCLALGELAADLHSNRLALMEHGGIKAIVDAMEKKADHAGVQEEGFWALRNLAINNDDNRVAVREQGGIKAIVDAMGKHEGHAVIIVVDG